MVEKRGRGRWPTPFIADVRRRAVGGPVQGGTMQREMRGATTVGRCLAGGDMVGEEKWGLTSGAPTTL
jgi:hypothetical protein